MLCQKNEFENFHYNPYSLYGRSLYGRCALYGRFFGKKSVFPYTDAPYTDAFLRILLVNAPYTDAFLRILRVNNPYTDAFCPLIFYYDAQYLNICVFKCLI